jgi:PAS domain S-box-containing protein
MNTQPSTATLLNTEAKFLFENAPVGMCSVGLKGEFLKANPRFCQLIGYSEEELLGLRFRDITHPEQAMVRGELQMYEREKRYIHKSGKVIWVSLTSTLQTDENGFPKYTITIIQDISMRKEFESNLKSAKDAAESANRLKSSFLANMSHEIRTPLGAILGFSQLLREKGLSEADREEYLDIINRSGQSLTQIIDDILDLSRVEAGSLKIEKSPVDIRILAEEVRNLFRVQAKKKNINIDVRYGPNTPEYIYSDPIRLKQVLINLIGNAVKFTAEGEVVLSLGIRNNTFCFDVSDTGIGIHRLDQEKLFHPFSQMDNSSTRRFGGTGLGLALSRRLSQALGGDLKLTESTPGQGSTFTLYHPNDTAQPALKNSRKPLKISKISDEDSEKLSHLKVLVVDDSIDNRYLVERALRRYGCQIELASNGLEGIQKAWATDCDIVLIDIQMPVMDGFEATRELRKAGFTKPIVALTAHAMRDEVLKCLESGCDAHISKPLKLDVMTEVILSVIKNT